jgi:hypothetical protein
MKETISDLAYAVGMALACTVVIVGPVYAVMKLVQWLS